MNSKKRNIILGTIVLVSGLIAARLTLDLNLQLKSYAEILFPYFLLPPLLYLLIQTRRKIELKLAAFIPLAIAAVLISLNLYNQIRLDSDIAISIGVNALAAIFALIMVVLFIMKNRFKASIHGIFGRFLTLLAIVFIALEALIYLVSLLYFSNDFVLADISVKVPRLYQEYVQLPLIYGLVLMIIITISSPFVFKEKSAK